MYDRCIVLEIRLKRILQGHRGRENAISRVALCEIFPAVQERKIRRTIKHLIIRHGAPIGSCPQGYFWAVTPGEIREVCQYFRSYGISCLRVAAKLQGRPLRLLLGQLIFTACKEDE